MADRPMADIGLRLHVESSEAAVFNIVFSLLLAFTGNAGRSAFAAGRLHSIRAFGYGKRTCRSQTIGSAR